MIKALIVSYDKSSNVIFKVALLDHDAQAMNRHFNSVAKARGSMVNFNQKVYTLAGLNLNLKAFKHLIDFEITDIKLLDYIVSEIEKRTMTMLKLLLILTLSFIDGTYTIDSHNYHFIKDCFTAFNSSIASDKEHRVKVLLDFIDVML